MQRKYFRLRRLRFLTQYSIVFALVVLLGLAIGLAGFFFGFRDQVFGISVDHVLVLFSVATSFIGVLGLVMLRALRVPTSQDPAQFKAMMAAMDEGIIAFDDQNRLLFSNRAARKLFDVKRKSIGLQLTQIEGYQLLGEMVDQARLTHSLVETTIETGEGDQRKVLKANARTFEGDATTGVIVVVHDVTELRRLERVRQDFVANVSHELKTPLTSIKGYVETLLAGAIQDPNYSERFLKKIDDNVGRLVALVQDLLSLARIEGAQTAMKLVPTDWMPVVQGVVARHENNFLKKDLDFIVDLPFEPVMVQGDREAMTQIFENLVDNAIKYTPQKGKVVVRLRRLNHKVYLEVEDTGIGIPEEDIDRVFERFYRVDKARSRAVQGTGLGLSIVKHLISSLGGDIQVQSKVGMGTKFVISMDC